MQRLQLQYIEDIEYRAPGINRTPAKVRRRAASRNLLRPPDATPQRDEVKAESANLVEAVVHGEEIPAEKSWCSWTIEFVCRCKRNRE